MQIRELRIGRAGGLDRAAAETIARIVEAYDSSVELHTKDRRGKLTPDPTSVTDLQVKQGDQVRLVVEGIDEQYALKALMEVLGKAGALRIFVASTFKDLAEFRAAAAESVRATGNEPELVGALAGATPQQVVEICRAKLQRCDACLIIVGEQRGSGPDDAGGWGSSFTELEIHEVVERKIPAFAYFVDRSAFAGGGSKEKSSFADYSRRMRWIEEFRRRLAGRVAFRWNIPSPEKLRFAVALDVQALSQGVVRPSMPPPSRFLR